MRAELKYLHSPDVSDLANYSPTELDNFSILIQAIIGPQENEGGESFDFVFCTLKYVESLMEKDPFLFGRGYIIVKKYEYNLIKKIIQDLCNRTFGNDWNTIANKINRFGYWEFEDYQSQ